MGRWSVRDQVLPVTLLTAFPGFQAGTGSWRGSTAQQGRRPLPSCGSPPESGRPVLPGKDSSEEPRAGDPGSHKPTKATSPSAHCCCQLLLVSAALSRHVHRECTQQRKATWWPHGGRPARWKTSARPRSQTTKSTLSMSSAWMGVLKCQRTPHLEALS